MFSPADIYLLKVNFEHVIASWESLKYTAEPCKISLVFQKNPNTEFVLTYSSFKEEEQCFKNLKNGVRKIIDITFLVKGHTYVFNSTCIDYNVYCNLMYRLKPFTDALKDSARPYLGRGVVRTQSNIYDGTLMRK